MQSNNELHTCAPKESLLVHTILAHSYLVYFAGVVVGIFVDIVFGWRISSVYFLPSLGALCIFLGTVLIVWSQKTSRTTAPHRNVEQPTIDVFLRGPYKILRAPTHAGLFFLVAGLGLFLNSLSIVGITCVVYIFSRSVLVPIEERRLLAKYGEVYRQYRAKVKF